MYNLTALSGNSTTTLGFVQGINNVLMFGWLGTVFLIGIAIVSFLSFMFATNDTGKSVGATAFIVFTLGILLRALNLVSNITLFIVLLLVGASLAILWPRD